MTEAYKNVLANKFMRDTNYIIIKDTDDIDELERQWELFNSCLTVRQQRLSDDRSIEIWNMTNQEHYEAIKVELMKKINSKFGDEDLNKEYNTFSYDTDEEINDDDITSILNTDLDSFKISDDNNDIIESVKEDSVIPIENNDTKISEPETRHDYSFLTTEQDIQKDNMADQYEIDTNIHIIGRVTGEDVDKYLSNLEKSFINFNAQTHDHRKKSDDKCREIYGMSNIERYNKLKADALKFKSIKTVEKVRSTDNETLDSSQIQQLGEFVSQVYDNMQIINEVENLKVNKHRRFNDTPYFTPNELIDMGVHSNHNFYSKQADNDGLITNVKIPTWFDSYKDMCMDHIFEDYRKDWIDTMTYLYSDFEDIKASGDEEKILARKQSILDLGWNPEIPFNRKNRLKASKRVSEIIDKTIPRDIFINLDNIVEEDDIVEEQITKQTHKPVLLIFTQGKTPVISQGIKFITGSSYSHASISFDPELNEVYSYNMRGDNFGFIKENLSSFKDNVISVIAFFAPNHIVESLKTKINDFKNNKTTFDLRIFFNKILHIDHKVSKNEYNQVCSTFVDTVLKSGGINLVGDIEIPDPGQLYNASKSIPNKIIEVFNDIATKYNGKSVKKKLDTLYNKSINDILEAATLPTGVTLRNATKDDVDNMFKWEMESIDKDNRNDPKIIKCIEKDVQESIKITKMIMYNGKTIGMFTTDRLEPGSDYWYIGEIYIVKEYRNKGIGTALLKDEISKHNKIKLQVDQSNHSAIKLYKSLGFEITDRNDKGKLYIMTLDKKEKPIKENKDFVDSINEAYLSGIVLESKKKQRKNDKGEIVPNECPKCGSKIGVFFNGEPIFKCTNNECNQYFGVMPFKESTFILNEVKQFPIEFDKDGNLIIYKARTGSLSYNDELADSVQLLESYRNTNNVEGIKYELAKVWFINDCIEKKLKKRLKDDEYKKAMNTRATCLNVFKFNLEYIMKIENGFNFSEYYNSTPFSDNSIKITYNTLKYTAKAITNML